MPNPRSRPHKPSPREAETGLVLTDEEPPVEAARNLCHAAQPRPLADILALPTREAEVHGCLCRVRVCPVGVAEGADFPKYTVRTRGLAGVTHHTPIAVGMYPPELRWGGTFSRKPRSTRPVTAR